MSSARWFLFLALPGLWFLTGGAVRSGEETPGGAPVPAAPAGVPGQAGTGEDAPAQAQEVQGPAPGTEKEKNQPAGLPVFPLKSAHFAQVVDGYSAEEQMDAQAIELESMEPILLALQRSPQAHLRAHVNPEAEFKELMVHPHLYRGHVVKLSGVLKSITKENVKIGNDAGITTIWRGHLSNASNHIITFYSLEPLPADLKLGTGAQIVGIFLKRYAFLNNEPGEKLTYSPLVFIHHPEPYSGLGAFSKPKEYTWIDLAALVIFLFIAAVLGQQFFSRMQGKLSKDNLFTQRRAEDKGQEGNYPGLGAKKNFPGPGSKPPPR